MRFKFSVPAILFSFSLLFPCSVKPVEPEPTGPGRSKMISQTPIDCPLREQGVNVDHMEPFGWKNPEKSGDTILIYLLFRPPRFLRHQDFPKFTF